MRHPVKKLLVLVVVAAGIGLYFCADRYGVRVGSYALVLDPDRDVIHRNTRRFLEDLQFKDFKHAGTFHTEKEQSERNIPELIEKKFAIKPELLDIRHFEVLRIDISDDGDRAKSVSNVTVKFLNTSRSVSIACIG